METEAFVITIALVLVLLVALLYLVVKTEKMAAKQEDLEDEIKDINTMIDIARMHEERSENGAGLPSKWHRPKTY